MQHHPQQEPSEIFNTPPALVTTEQIQKCLDENYGLILAIMDSQELGKLADSAQYEDRLQKNLTFLAAAADAQPEPQMTPPSPQPMVQQGHIGQHHQSAITEQKLVARDPGRLSSQPISLQLNDQVPEQQMIQFHHHQQQQGLGFQPPQGLPFQQPMPSPLGLRSIGLINGSAYHTMQYGFGHSPSYMDAYSRADGSEAGTSDAQGKQSRFG